jgi:hypothetical protein
MYPRGPCELTRWSACCRRGVVGIRPCRRSAAWSSTAHGRGRCGSSACASRVKAWTLAIAAPASRSRARETVRGRSLLPDRTVSTLATVPLALPSRSALTSSGAARRWVSASRRARAFVTTMPSSIQPGTGTFKINSAVGAPGRSILSRTCQTHGGRCGRGSRLKERASPGQPPPPSAAPGNSASLLCALPPSEQSAEHRRPPSQMRLEPERLRTPYRRPRARPARSPARPRRVHLGRTAGASDSRYVKSSISVLRCDRLA